MRQLLRTACVLAMILTVSFAYATSVGISTSGGDRDTFVDRWRDQNTDRVCQQLALLGIGDCKKIKSKVALRDTLLALVDRLQCGDTLVLYFNGHGSKESGLVFDKEDHDSANRHVQPAEILEWLSGLPCCVSIYVAWHACFSGRFTEELSADPHVKVAVSSSSADKTSHRAVLRRPGLADLINPLNWADGFAGGLKPGDRSLAEIFQHAAREARERAEGEDENKRRAFEDDPQDFKRGHIESVKKRTGGFHVVLKTGPGDRDTVGVFIPRNGNTGFKGLTREELQYCMNIDISGEAQFDGNGNFMPTNVNITHFGGKFHVLRVVNRNQKRVEVVYTEPVGLKNTIGTVIMDPLPADVQFCKWYRFHGAVEGQTIMSNPDSLRPTTSAYYEWKGHVQQVDPVTGEIVLTVTSPKSLAGNVVRVKPAPGQNIPADIVTCMIISFSGMPEAINKVALENINTIEVQPENITAHVEEVDPATRNVKVTIQGTPQRRHGEVVTLKPDPAENIDGLEFCKTIFLQGKIYQDEIREGKNIQVLN